MLDPQLFRTDLEDVVAALAGRGYAFDVKRYRKLEAQRKELQVEVESIRAARNQQSKKIGKMKAAGENAELILQEVAGLGDQLAAAEQVLEKVQVDLDGLLHSVPNLPANGVPDGFNEEQNKELRTWGKIKSFDFEVSDHVDLGTALGQMDFEVAAKLTGSRFVVLKGQLARLHRALIQFMLDVHTEQHGYSETYVPYLVNRDSLFGTGQLPKFEEDQFCATEDDFFLIPTAEVPLTNMYRRVITPAEQLPIKMVAHTPCFRREAGSYGRDTRGMIRQHQFEKVELVQLVHPEHSVQALEELTGHAERILQLLELPYRAVALCKGDLGFSANKTYDLEVWLPSQQCYREISSCSSYDTFQARRMQARYRSEGDKPQLLHTLNGSGLAVGRTLLAIMENYQTTMGEIVLPAVIQPYMGGQRQLSPI
ncbi:MAG: serine--tRNA ligase [Proteobacteria bacterium]|jgi:seryl-tRNA synthetase|nr:serine--tRNA ligase [Pseudomonadota bacterium]